MQSDDHSVHPLRPRMRGTAPLAAAGERSAGATTTSGLGSVMHALAVCGYGLWMLLGLAMALGIYSDGRGEALVPLTLGAALVSLGLLLAVLRLPGVPDWHGWRFGQMHRPTREALVALAAYLPMLAVAALARGDNVFWATRVASLVLMLCSLSCLLSGDHHDPARRLLDQQGKSILLPISRIVAGIYSGGLWLWSCVMAQDPGERPGLPWVLGLLILALLQGLLESVRWQTLPNSRPAAGAQPWSSGRFLAAVLVYAVPCILLLLAHFLRDSLWLAATAALSGLAGLCIEQKLYDRALARLDEHLHD